MSFGRLIACAQATVADFYAKQPWFAQMLAGEQHTAAGSDDRDASSSSPTFVVNANAFNKRVGGSKLASSDDDEYRIPPQLVCS